MRVSLRSSSCPYRLASSYKKETGEVWSFYVFPVAIWILAKSTERTTPKIYMTLYPERVECCGGEQDFKWSEVEGIHWPRWQDDKHRIRIRVAPGETHTSHEVQISLRSLSARDQMALVQYLRRLGARLEQKNWPEFCRNRAIPLVERSQQKDISNRNGSPEATTRFNEWLSRHSERHPFLSGFLVLPVVMIVFAFAPVLCPPSIVILTIFYRREISRKIWWMLSTVTCITTVTNTRLVWGTMDLTLCRGRSWYCRTVVHSGMVCSRCSCVRTSNTGMHPSLLLHCRGNRISPCPECNRSRMGDPANGTIWGPCRAHSASGSTLHPRTEVEAPHPCFGGRLFASLGGLRRDR